MECIYQQKSVGVRVLVTVGMFTIACSSSSAAAGAMFGADGTCGSQKNYPGDHDADVTVTGLLQIHEGPACDTANPEGVQMLEAARWATSKINQLHLIPGTTIGVNIWDICGSGDAALRAAMSAVVDGGYLLHGSCREQQNAGMLLTQGIVGQVAPFLHDVGVAYTTLMEKEQEEEIEKFDALIPLLQRLNWTSVALAATTAKSLKSFGHVAAGSNICVSAEVYMPEDTSDIAGYTEMFEAIVNSDTSGTILIGPQEHLHAALSHAAQANITALSFILMPSGPLQEDFFQGLGNVIGPHGIPAVRRASQAVPEFGQHFLDAAYYSGPPLYPTLSSKEYVEEHQVIQMVKSMYSIGLALRNVVKEQCAGAGWCSNATLNSLNYDLQEDDTDFQTALNINPMAEQYDILFMEFGESTNRITFTGVSAPTFENNYMPCTVTKSTVTCIEWWYNNRFGW